jgi:hypothetical protein
MYKIFVLMMICGLLFTIAAQLAMGAESYRPKVHFSPEKTRIILLSLGTVPIKQTEKDKPTEWEFNSINGKGFFMGDSFAVYNHMHKRYGEGDQKIWIDVAKFPTEYDTGTEDYYNISRAPVVLYQTPFANAPRADNVDSFFTPICDLDGIPFKNSFRYTFEMLGWENGSAGFAATTYWYGFKTTKSKVAAEQTKPDILPNN